MTGEEATIGVFDALEALEIPYLVVGSLSTSHYGIPRSTKDADIVVELGERSVWELMRRLGPGFRLDPQLSFESATSTLRHKIHLVESEFTIELFYLGRDPHDQERFRRRVRAVVHGREVWIPTVEDAVITKLRWALRLARAKDRDDAREVIAVQGDRIDWDYVHRWCDEHGTRALLDEIRASIPPI
jgi:hypothetical protein